MGLTSTAYQVEEDDRARVCVRLLGNTGGCIVPFSLYVYLNTTDGEGNLMSEMLYTAMHLNLFLAVSPDDFDGGSQILRLPPCSTEVCAYVEVVNDELVEGDEVFHISLFGSVNMENRIHLTTTKANITIIDDDSKTFWVLSAPL